MSEIEYPIRRYQHSYALSEDGERFRERESYVLIYPQGTVEGWRTPVPKTSPGWIWGPDPDHYGGVEVHSKTPQYTGHEPLTYPCQWTGGDCYIDGSSRAFDQIALAFDSPDFVFDELMRSAPIEWLKLADFDNTRAVLEGVSDE